MASERHEERTGRRRKGILIGGEYVNMACPEGGNVASDDLQGDASENASTGNRRLFSTSVSLWYDVQARGPRGVQVGFCLHKQHGCDLTSAATREGTPVTTLDI